MNMNKKLLLSIAPIVLAITVIGGATWALFAVQDKIEGYEFATGGVNISLTGSDAAFSVFNIAPGWSEEKTFIVTNTGNLPIYIKVSMTGSGDLGNVLKAIIKETGDNIVYPTGNQSGLLKDLAINDVPLAEGANISYKIIVSLPTTTNNDYENNTYNGTIIVDAVQQEYQNMHDVQYESTNSP